MARSAQLARLGPAPEQEQRVGHVARQEVAVDGLETGPPGILDAFVGHLDRLGPPAHEVEDGGQVGADPEQRVRVVELAGARLGLAQELDRGGRVAPPGQRDRQRRQGVDLLRARHRVAGAGDLHRLAGQPLRLGEDAVEHLELGERGHDGRPLRARLAGDELDRAPGCVHRARRVAGRPPDVRQPLVEQAQPDAVAPPIETADRRLEVGRRARRSGRPRRRPRRRAPGGRPGPVPGGDRRRAAAPVDGRSGSDSASSSAASSSAAAWRAAAAAAASMAAARAADGSNAPSQCAAIADGRPVEARRQRRVVARPGDRQQVPRDGLADRVVPEPDRVVALDEEAVGERLGPAGPEVRVEDTGARPRAGDRARRRPARCRARRRPRPPPAARDVSGRSASASRRSTRRHSASGRPSGR